MPSNFQLLHAYLNAASMATGRRRTSGRAPRRTRSVRRPRRAAGSGRGASSSSSFFFLLPPSSSFSSSFFLLSSSSLSPPPPAARRGGRHGRGRGRQRRWRGRCVCARVCGPEGLIPPFAECPRSGTRQSFFFNFLILCRVPHGLALDKDGFF